MLTDRKKLMLSIGIRSKTEIVIVQTKSRTFWQATPATNIQSHPKSAPKSLYVKEE